MSSPSYECCICLEDINYNEGKEINRIITCKGCKNHFHRGCILKSGRAKCPLCRQSIAMETAKYQNYTFNNMDDHNRYLFDIDIYLKKWKNQKCISDNHHFILETLGDWGIHQGELSFDYNCMYIKCTQCDCHEIIG